MRYREALKVIERAILLAALAETGTVTGAAQMLGMGRTTLYRRIYYHKIKLPPKSMRVGRLTPTFDRQKIRKLREQNLTHQVICERLGCCRETVRQAEK